MLIYFMLVIMRRQKILEGNDKKRSSKTIDIVSCALKVSENGVTCVCSPFQVIRHI